MTVVCPGGKRYTPDAIGGPNCDGPDPEHPTLLDLIFKSYFPREDSVNITEPPVKMQLRGSSTGGTGPDLAGYPHLTYAPHQWGEGVRVASNGASVEDIADRCSEQISDLRFAAVGFGITMAELCDVIRYSQDR